VEALLAQVSPARRGEATIAPKAAGDAILELLGLEIFLAYRPEQRSNGTWGHGERLTLGATELVDRYDAMLWRFGFGIPAPMAKLLADTDAGIARGDLVDRSGALRRLIGRPTTKLSEAVADGLRSLHGLQS